jgi:hypothetical protein
MDHVTDGHPPHSHGHAHDHSHGQDHGHDHHHGGSDYYLQQLLTVFICGAFGVAGVLMYTLGKLQFILAPAFHIWVLVGSGLLLFGVAVRMLALWKSAGTRRDHHHHDHAHGEDCGHDHKPGETCDHHHGHDHGDHTAEDHEHGNVYVKVVVLAFPVVILAMGLPNKGFSSQREGNMVGKMGDVSNLAEVKDKDGISSDFDLLATIAYDPVQREAYTGQKASIIGKYRRETEKQFTLYKMKMTCCSADMIPLKAAAIVKNASQLTGFFGGEDIEVTGRIQFTQDASSGEWLTVLRVESDGLKRVKASN